MKLHMLAGEDRLEQPRTAILGHKSEPEAETLRLIPNQSRAPPPIVAPMAPVVN
jgi:hypothetical protein